MKNIELKVKTKNFHRAINLLKKLGATRRKPLFQVDTYFHSPVGRLKTREINRSSQELIYYQRPDSRKSKVSTYKIIPLSPAELKITKNILGRLYKKWLVVKKNRDLWRFKHTRIHLDNVQNLGNFIELETVANEIDIRSARREHKAIVRELQLLQFKKISHSYSDLLAARSNLGKKTII